MLAPWLSGAAVLDRRLDVREDDYHERYRKPDKLERRRRRSNGRIPYWHFDAGAAAMLILLAAIDEGLRRRVVRASRRRQPNLSRTLLRYPR